MTNISAEYIYEIYKHYSLSDCMQRKRLKYLKINHYFVVIRKTREIPIISLVQRIFNLHLCYLVLISLQDTTDKNGKDKITYG